MFNQNPGMASRSLPESWPEKRHHSARYLASRVRESLATRLSKFLCSIFLSLLLFVGIIIFILWLSLRPHRPKISIHDFSIQGLGHDNGSEHARITFNASTRNPNLNIGIYYDSMVGSVYYEEKQIGSTPLRVPLYQGPKNSTVVAGTLSGTSLTANKQRWMEIVNERPRGTVGFRLDLTAIIRFKISAWNSKHHRMHASCDVGVGPDGNILPLYEDKRCAVYFS